MFKLVKHLLLSAIIAMSLSGLAEAKGGGGGGHSGGGHSFGGGFHSSSSASSSSAHTETSHSMSSGWGSNKSSSASAAPVSSSSALSGSLAGSSKQKTAMGNYDASKPKAASTPTYNTSGANTSGSNTYQSQPSYYGGNTIIVQQSRPSFFSNPLMWYMIGEHSGHQDNYNNGGNRNESGNSGSYQSNESHDYSISYFRIFITCMMTLLSFYLIFRLLKWFFITRKYNTNQKAKPRYNLD